MSFLSGLKTFVTATTFVIRNATQKVWEKAKVVAAEALLWMADKTEAFVGNVKDLWNRVKPSLVYYFWSARRILESLIPDPLLSGLLNVVSLVIDWAVILENTILAKKIEAAIRWVIDAVRKFADWILSKADYVAARAHQTVLNQALVLVRSPERRTLELARLTNTFLLLQSDLTTQINSSNIENFETYLRLRATQKLVKLTKAELERLTDVDRISEDDLFVIEVGGKLIAPEPMLTDEEVQRLDEIIRRRHGKNLLSFVFEEMVIAWGVNLNELKSGSNAALGLLRIEKRDLVKLSLKEGLSGFSEEEKLRLAALRTEVPKLETVQKDLRKRINEMKKYIWASQGLLEMLEKSPDELEAEGRGYVREEATEVGKIIIDCAQNGKNWEALTEEEQELITDYANIYREASEDRVKQLITVEVRG